jgi:hypothetical protein
MDIRIEPYEPQHVDAVRSFNARLQGQGGSNFRLSERAPQPSPRELPLRSQEYLALDRGAVRGSFILKQQQFWINGQTVEIGNCQLPISEGSFNPAYVNLGMVLMRQALRMQPRLFCLGMGNRDNRLPKMLTAMGWTLIDIPFLFRVKHPFVFLRNIVPLRTTMPRRLAMDALAISGGGWLGIRAFQARTSRVRAVDVEVVNEFESWADYLWDQCKTSLSLSALRTSSTLNFLYPAAGRFLRLKMSRGQNPVGWVVLRDTQMQDHRYFGNLRVGTIVDGLAVPDAIPSVVETARKFLERSGVDLTISNQGHESWVTALRQCGFLPGPSNFIMAMSPKLAGLLNASTGLHINRGDGDGPLDL